MTRSSDAVRTAGEKVQRNQADAVVGDYHQEQLRSLLEHVREGFNQLDSGAIDEFDLDDLVHRYKRAAKQLWLFCESRGAYRVQVAGAINQMKETGQERDWWGESARGRD